MLMADTSARQFHVTRRQTVIVLVAGAFLAVLLYIRRTDVLASIGALRDADARLLIPAATIVCASYLAAAMSYWVLALRPVRYLETLAVQMAAGLANRLLPAGLGAFGLFGAFLHRHRHTYAEAGGVLAANNIIGIIGTILLIMAVLVFQPDTLQAVRWPAIPVAVIITAALAITAAAVLLYASKAAVRARILAFLHELGHTLRGSLKPNSRTAGALAANIAITSLSAMTLALCVQAAGASPFGWSAALIVLSFGTLIGVATPTPGGLGGVELGLVSGLIAFGAATPQALAAVLMYRGLTYWLPIIPGIFMLRYVVKRYL